MPSSKSISKEPSNTKLKQSCLSFLPVNKDSITPTLVKCSEGEAENSKPSSSTSSHSTKMLKSTAVKRKSSTTETLKKHAKSKEKSKNDKKKSKKKKEKESLKKAEPIVVSDEDDEVPLSMLKNKMDPEKKRPKITIPPSKVVLSPKFNSQSIKLLNKNIKIPIKTIVKPLPVEQVKLSSTAIQSLLPNLKIGSPIKSLTPAQLTSVQNFQGVTRLSTNPSVKPIFVVPKKIEPNKIIIAIDMDPEKWKKLDPIEQQRIIAVKRAQINVNPRNIITVAIKSGPQQQQKPIVGGKQLISIGGNRIPMTAATSDQLRKKLNASIVPISRVIEQTSLSQQKIHTVQLQKGQPLLHTPKNTISTAKLQQTGQNVYSFTDLIAEKRHESELPGLRPLPKLRKVHIPPPLNGKQFGDIIMVSEFIDTFKKFLQTDENFPLKTDDIMKAIAEQKESETVLKILLYFLKVLLGNESFKIRNLKIELADLPLTEFTVSFLIEQFLKSWLEKKKKQKRAEEIAAAAARILSEEKNTMRKSMAGSYSDSDEDWYPPPEEALFDDDEDDSEFGSRKKKKKKPTDRFQKKEFEYESQIQAISKFLEKNEFHELSAQYQTQVLSMLMHLVMESEEFSSYYEEINKDRLDAIRENELYKKQKRCAQMAESMEASKIHSTKPLSPFSTSMSSSPKITTTTDSKQTTIPTGNKHQDNGGESSGEKSSGEKKKEKKEEKKEEKEGEDTKGEDTTPAVTDPYAGMTQRQVQAIKEEARQAEQKRHDKIREKTQEEKDFALKLVDRVKEATDLYSRAQRLEPLGYDRHDRMYWIFSDANPGLYICSMGFWYFIDDMKTVDELQSALTVRGIREEKLKRAITRNYSKIQHSLALAKTNKPVTPPELSVLKFLNGGRTTTTTTTTTPAATSNNVNKDGTDVSTTPKNEPTTERKDDILDSKVKKGKIEENSSEETLKDKDGTHQHSNKEPSKTENGLHGNDPGQSRTTGVIDLSKDVEIVKTEDSSGSKTVETRTPSTTTAIKTTDGSTTLKREDAKLAITSQFPSSIDALKSDLLESSQKIVQGNLGVLRNYDEWSALLTSAQHSAALKPFVKDLQKSLYEKSFLSPFKGFDSSFANEWLKAVEQADTLSKLHTLYGILENSISWEKSSETMRCNACRRKQGNRNTSPMVICDGCQNAYHMNCIRPPLTEVPESVWLCPRCVPKDDRKSRKICQDYKEQAEDEEDSDHEDTCHVCGGDGMVILCDTCPLSFHFDCHDPPLRRAPKGAWSCYECRKNNLKKHNYKKDQIKSNKTGTNRSNETSGNSSEEEEEEFAVETSSLHKKKNTTKTTASNSKNNKKDIALKLSSTSSASRKPTPVEEHRHQQHKQKQLARDMSPSDSSRSRGRKRKTVNYNEDTLTDDEAEKHRGDESEDDDGTVSHNNSNKNSGGRRGKATSVNSNSKKSKRNSSSKTNAALTPEQNGNIESSASSGKSNSKNRNASSNKKRTSKRGQTAVAEVEESPTNGVDLSDDGDAFGADDEGADNDSGGSGGGPSNRLAIKRPRYAKDLSKKKNERDAPNNSTNTGTTGKKAGKTKSRDGDRDGSSSSESISSSASTTTSQDAATTATTATTNNKKSKKTTTTATKNTSARRNKSRNRGEAKNELKACRSILVELRKERDANPFLNPVSRRQFPGYYGVVEQPMDFGTIMKKLDSLQYDDAIAFVDDINLVFRNCQKFFQDPDNKIRQSEAELSKRFSELLDQHLPGVPAV